MGLDRFLFRKEILIDDAGWGDLILGVVIGALELPEHKYMERRISVSSFQLPNFENKQYLDDSLKIAEEIVEVMKADERTSFKVCSGYVLSSIREYLRNRGFHVEEVVITGELQERVERGYLKWCVEVGVPVEKTPSILSSCPRSEVLYFNKGPDLHRNVRFHHVSRGMH